MAPSTRLLRLLSLLESKPRWSATDLAARLNTTDRTVRRDIAKLRDIGYPVEGTAGEGGGYRLGAGASLPPLLFEDEEAVAVVTALHLAAAGAVPGLQNESLAALAKIDQLLPGTVRRRVDTIRAAAVDVASSGEPIDAQVLLTLALGCRNSERVRIVYRERERTVEPYRLSVETGRWYLLSRDVASRQWRTFRVGGITEATLTGHQFEHRPLPRRNRPADAGQPTSTTVTIRAHARVSMVRAYIPPAVGTVKASADEEATATMTTDDPDWLVRFLFRLPFLIEIEAPRSFRMAVRDRARRLARMNS